MQQFKLDEAQAHLKDLIAEAMKGKEIYILQDDWQMVQLVPVEPPERHPQFGSAKGLVAMADDFDASLAEIACNVAAALQAVREGHARYSSVEELKLDLLSEP